MLRHEWMQKRDRRAHRSDRDDQPDDLQGTLGEMDEDAEAAGESLLTPDALAPDADQDSGARDVDESPPSEGLDQTPVPATERVDPPEPGPFPEASADEPLSLPAEEDDVEGELAEPEDEPEQVEAEAVDAGEEPAPPAAETRGAGLGPLLAQEPSRGDPKDVIDNLNLPVSTLRDRLEQVLARQTQLPLDIQTRHEVSERAPDGPGEARDELIQRLLDPTLNLQEVSTLLGVCRTTVRRYTTRGILRCFRTPGNQRRFHLSDILDFLERQQRGE